jgi:hypothetical protein
MPLLTTEAARESSEQLGLLFHDMLGKCQDDAGTSISVRTEIVGYMGADSTVFTSATQIAVGLMAWSMEAT